MGKPYLCQVSRRSIGIGDLPGGFAEYVKVFPDMLIPIPENVDFLNGALAEVFATSLHAMNAVGQTRGTALVIGGGPIGLTLVNLLKLSGVSSVVLSEPTENRRRLGSHFGADWCVDPFEENFAEGMSKITEGRGFETVFECSGAEVSVRTALDAVRQGGKICVVSVILREVPIQPFMLNFKEVWMTGVYSNTHSENACCLAWMSEGKIDGRALISHLIDLEQLPDIYLSQIHTGKAVKVMIQTETSGLSG
jgi:threonine dehydrogenase-like Zn-dependent dehydrogenase